jgi:hypothetical protein
MPRLRRGGLIILIIMLIIIILIRLHRELISSDHAIKAMVHDCILIAICVHKDCMLRSCLAFIF